MDFSISDDDVIRMIEKILSVAHKIKIKNKYTKKYELFDTTTMEGIKDWYEHCPYDVGLTDKQREAVYNVYTNFNIDKM